MAKIMIVIALVVALAPKISKDAIVFIHAPILGEAGERFLHLGMKTIASLAPGPQRGQ
jgi:hypothetical protein